MTSTAGASVPDPTSTPRRHGWHWYFAWALPGVVLGLQVSVIGFLLLPIGAVAVLFLARLTRAWPEPLGVLVGVAGVFVFIAYVNRDGGLDPLPWLVAGLGLAIAGGARLRARALIGEGARQATRPYRGADRVGGRGPAARSGAAALAEALDLTPVGGLNELP